MQTICHLSALLSRQAEKYGNRKAFIYKKFGEETWRSASWFEANRDATRLSAALLKAGLVPQEKIGVFSPNSLEYLYTYHAAWKTRICVVPFYANSSAEQIQFMVNDAHIRIIFAGRQEQYDKAFSLLPVCPCLEKIVVYDDTVCLSPYDKISVRFSEFIRSDDGDTMLAEAEQRLRDADDNDLLGILYTSGTTGITKGVMLSYAQAQAALVANDKPLTLTENDRVLNFLPFAHIFEMAWSLLTITDGAISIILNNPADVLAAMREVRPTCMCAVPRFWEKLYVAVCTQIDTMPKMKQRLFRHALAVGRKHNIEYIGGGKRPPIVLEVEYRLMDSLVFSVIRREIGLDRPNFFPVAGAFVSAEVEEFVHSIGIFMMVGYGLTESFATVSNVQKGKAFTIGSIGHILEGLRVKIGDDNEILLKGPTITQGYYNRPDINTNAFTHDGYFRTGDAGYIKGDELYITERIKDLFKTSNGKYISPQMVEAKLLVDKFIDMVAVIADSRKFVSALIVPAYPMLEAWADEHGLAFASREEMCADENIVRMMMKRIDILQQSLATYEQVKRITLLPRHFSIDRQEMTATLKIRRNVVNEHYKSLIDKMYTD
ncbi:MAG: long-chain fatty acid--CoA ligase [Prevotella sp.]|nr:long-chain fatty acid--CoA ligase [Prevotella sp.]